MTYILIDANNLFHRCKHVTHGDADTKGAMAIHIVFNAINKAWRMFNGTHLVLALEGGRRTDSWRYKIYNRYKAARATQALERTQRERDDDAIYFEYMNEFTKFMAERTNCTVLSAASCEADDCIARWIYLHSQDKHVILSSDSDFYQLLSKNVQIYNGITNETINLDGFFDDKGSPVINKKTGKPKCAVNPEWELFKKCMLGDASDGVFRAAPPRIRETKIRDAFDDFDKKGFSWNNLMLSTWIDHNGEERRVIDRYNENKVLVDLKAQPDDIKTSIDSSILESVQKDKKTNVGVWFLRFCNTYSLKRIEDNAEKYTAFLNAPYGEG